MWSVLLITKRKVLQKVQICIKPLHIWTKTPLLRSNQSINMLIQELLRYMVPIISTLEFSVLYTIRETCRISVSVRDIFLRLSSEGWPKRTESHEDLLN